MLYDAYKNKILRIAAIKRWIVRFKLPIIIVLSLLLAALAAFLFTKGTITTNVSVATQEIRYGDAYELTEAKALFGSIREYEYSPIGEEAWTTEKPTAVGKYYVRAVANGGFGRKRGAAVAFEILPKPVTFAVRDESVIYGENPADIDLSLAAGDTLVYDQLRFDFADFTVEETDVIVDTRSIRIENARGENVTSYYVITPVSKNIRLLNKNIRIVPRNGGKVFDGSGMLYEPSADDDTQAALKDDGITFETVIYNGAGEIVDAPVLAGTYRIEVVPETVKIVKNGVDVTARYTLSFAPSILTVAPKNLEIVTASARKDYDGTAISAKEFTAETVIAGHRIVCLTDGIVSRTEVGVTKNEYSFTVVDAFGNDVSDNYKLNVTFGDLVVDQRALSVKTEDHTFEYDGQPHVWPHYDERPPKLLAGHTLRYTEASVTKITSVGSAENALRFEVYDGGRNVTANYEITTLCGTLTVIPRRITVTAGDLTAVYDGNSQSNIYAYSSDLLDEHICRVADPSKVISIRDVGERPNDYKPADYTIWDGDRDVSANYQIDTVIQGVLRITPKTITVTTADAERPYDGTPLDKRDGFQAVGLVDDGAYIELDPTRAAEFGTITDAGEAVNTLYFIVRNADGNTSGNYTIDYGRSAFGKLTVTSKTITVVTESASKTYDGDRLVKRDGFQAVGLVNDGSYIELDPMRAAEFGTITDAGETANTLYFTVRNADGSLSGNYRIDYDRSTFGKLTVDKRPITVTTDGGTHEYDAQAFYVDTARVTGGDGLVEKYGHRLAAIDSTITKIKTVGESGAQNRTQFGVYAGGLPVTANYAVTYVYGTLYITQRPIAITTGSAEKEYDGTALQKADCKSDGLVAGHSIEADPSTVTARITVGTEQNKTQFIIRESGADVSVNYTIAYTYGTLTVTKRNVLIVTVSDAKIYDGTPLSNDGTRVHHIKNNAVDMDVTDGLVLSHISVRTSEEVSITDVGRVDNVNRYDIYDGSVNVTENYAILYELDGYDTVGTLEVLKRPLRIQTGTKEFEYDGTAHSFAQAEVMTAAGYYPLVGGHTLQVTAITYVTDVQRKIIEDNVYGGEIGVDNEVAIAVFDGTRDVTHNYDCTAFEYGTLTVMRRRIMVTTPSAQKVYDGAPLEVTEETTFIHIASEGKESAFVLDAKPALLSQRLSITHVRESCENKEAYTVVDNGNHLSLNYSLRYTYGTLTVTPRPLTVYTGSARNVYDDAWLSQAVYDHTENLLDWQQLRPIDSTVTKIRDVGKTANKTEYTVYDPKTSWNAGDVTSDYTIAYEFGTLEITKRPMTIVLKSESFEYDGEKHLGVYESRPDALIAAHYLSLTDDYSYGIDAGTYVNESKYKIYANDRDTAANANDVTNNYDITYVKGTLTVTPRPIRITVMDGEWEYDGQEHFERRAAKVEHLWQLVDGTFVADGKQGLVLSHAAVAQGDDVVIVNAWQSVVNRYDYRIMDGTTDVSGNYTIVDVAAGTLTITRRALTVTRTDQEKVYDGDPLYGDAATGDRLVAGHSLQAVAPITQITNVGQSGKTIETLFIVVGGTYQDGHTADENYSITYADGGTLTIKPRPVTIETASIMEEYDGKPHRADEYHIVAGTLVKEHVLVRDMNVAVSITDAGSVENEMRFSILDGDSDVTGNYAITVKAGRLTITRRAIRVRTADDERVYNGMPLEKTDGYAIVLGTLAEDQTIEVDISKKVTITNVGTRSNDLAFVVRASGKNVTENYAITLDAGTLTVTPRTLYIRPNDRTSVYDGTAYKYDGTFSYFGDSLSSDHQLAIVNGVQEELQITVSYGMAADPVHAGEYVILIDSAAVTNGNRRIGNYSLVCETATLKIEKRAVVLRAPEISVEYNGQAVDMRAYPYDSYRQGDPDVIGVLDDDRYLFVPVYTYFDQAGQSIAGATDAGVYTVEIEYVTTDMALINDYTYAFAPSTLTIKKRKVSLRPIRNDGKDYDGKVVTYEDIVGNGAAYETDDEVALREKLQVRATFDGAVRDPDGSVCQWVDGVESVVDAAIYDVRFDWAYLAENNPNFTFAETAAGLYEIRKLRISVKNGSLTTEYTGDWIYAPENLGTDVIDEKYRDLIEGLGHEIKTTGEKFRVRNCGEYVNRQSINIVDADGVECMHNYTIDFVEGTITVTKKTLTVSIALSQDERVKTYDATQFKLPTSGKDAAYSIDGLVYGHTLKDMTWSEMIAAGTYDDYTLTRYSVYNGDSDVDIIDGIVYALKDNYALTYVHAPITIEKRGVTFVNDLSIRGRVYNGVEQPLGRDECLTGDFDTLDTQFALQKYTVVRVNGFDARLDYSALLYAGTYTVQIDKADVILDGVANNPNYAIGGDDRLTFEVTIDRYAWTGEGRDIVVYTASGEKPYDGTPLKCPADPDFGQQIWLTVSDGSFPTGVRIAFDAGSAPQVLAPDEQKANVLRFLLVDNAYTDVTANFDFGAFVIDYDNLDPTYYQAGTLHISPKIRLELYNADATVLYDGEAHATVSGYVSDGRDGHYDPLLFTFRAQIASVYRKVGDDWIKQDQTSIIEAGDYLVCYEAIKLYQGSQELAADVAEILLQNIVNERDGLDGGYMCARSIIPRLLYARPIDKSLAYDGTVNVLRYESDEFILFGDSCNGLAEGHTFRLLETSDVLNITEKVSLMATITRYEIVDREGNVVTHNYKVFTDYDAVLTPDVGRYDFRGRLQFVRRVMHVTPVVPDGKEVFVYDGEEHAIEYASQDGSELFTDVSGLADGHYIKVYRASASAEPGKKTTWLRVKVYAMDSDGKEIDVSKGYDIRYDQNAHSAITVIAADLTVESGSADKTYDGGALTCDDMTVTLNGKTVTAGADGLYMLTEKHALRITVIGTMTEVGQTENLFEYELIRISGENQYPLTLATRYYNVTCTYGKLTVHK